MLNSIIIVLQLRFLERNETELKITMDMLYMFVSQRGIHFKGHYLVVQAKQLVLDVNV